MVQSQIQSLVPSDGRERGWADALDKLCLSTTFRVIRIFNTALQDFKKICRIRGCKPAGSIYGSTLHQELHSISQLLDAPEG